MIEIFFSLIVLIFLVLISGAIASNYILKININNLEVYEIGLLGIVFLVFLSFIVHLFLPLNEIYNSIIFFITLMLFIFEIFKKKNVSVKFDYKIIIISFLVVFIMTLKYKPNEDYGYYHLPYIINLVSDKIIFGFSNLQPQFGWNSSWLNFSSLFYLPLLKIKGTQLSNSLLFFFVIYFFIKEIISSKNRTNISFIFVLILSCYVIIKFSRINGHGFDFPANIFLLLAFYYFLKIFEEENKLLIKKYFIIIVCFSLFAITIKLSAFAAPLLVISAFILLLIKNIDLNFLRLPIVFCTLFFLLWIFQQFIFTGCFIPYFELTCIESLEWHTKGISKMISSLTGSVNKSYSVYSGDLSSEEYIKNFNWVNTWFNRNKVEFLEHFIALIVPFIIMFFLNIKYLFCLRDNNFHQIKLRKLYFTTLVLFCFIGLSIWFLKSPVIRFGIPYLFVFIFLLLMLIVNFFKINLQKGIYLVLILSLTFNVSKNLNRIEKNKAEEYWPVLLNFNYSSIIKNDFIINYPDSGQDSLQERLCWSIPYICSASRGKGLNFYKKFSYTFIKNELNVKRDD